MDASFRRIAGIRESRDASRDPDARRDKSGEGESVQHFRAKALGIFSVSEAPVREL